MKIYKKAFTLIELLIVIAIIGMLSALLLPNFMGARERARDSQRKSDLKQIQKALEMYKQDQSLPTYPTSIPTTNTCWTSGGVGDPCPAGNIYMNRFPTDPSPGKQYYYSVDNNNLNYTLCACLENKADSDGSTNCVVCGSCSSEKCYLVNQP